MADYIEREAFLKSVLTAGIGKTIVEYSESDIGYMIRRQPAADVAPVVHGQWIEREGPDEDGNIIEWCSRCWHSDTHSPNVNVYYCWFCGAKMQEAR